MINRLINRLITRLINRRPEVAIEYIQNRANRALTATITGNCATGHAITGKTIDAFGPTAAYPMITTWCDAALTRVPGYPFDDDTNINLEFSDPDDTTVEPDQVLACQRWTGQIIAARARGDQDMFDALFEALPADPFQLHRHLGALLHFAASATVQGPDG
jgi:hypothetical protein